MLAAIDACYRVDEGESISHPMEALKYYAAIVQNVDVETKVIKVRLRAERASKRLLRDLQKSK